MRTGLGHCDISEKMVMFTQGSKSCYVSCLDGWGVRIDD